MTARSAGLLGPWYVRCRTDLKYGRPYSAFAACASARYSIAPDMAVRGDGARQPCKGTPDEPAHLSTQIVSSHRRHGGRTQRTERRRVVPGRRRRRISRRAGSVHAIAQGVAGQYRHGVRAGATPGTFTPQRVGGNPVTRHVHAGHRGERRTDGRAQSRLCDSAGARHDHCPRHIETPSARRPRATPHDRSVFPRASRRFQRAGHWRRPVGHCHRRHPRIGGDQSQRRHHLCPGCQRAARRNDTQRHCLRVRGFRAAAG